MPNLQTTSAAQLLRATGNAGLEIANVRKGQKGNAPADSVANMGENFQRQIDAIKQVLLTPPPPVTQFNVIDSLGALIAWIGSSVITGITYFGAWFQQIRIGGKDASDARIIADQAGDVTITNATITLTKDGVTTIIDGSTNPLTGHPQGLQVKDIVDPTKPYASIGPDDIILSRQFGGIDTLTAQLHQNADGGLLNLFNGTSPAYHITLDNTIPSFPSITVDNAPLAAIMNTAVIAITNGTDTSAMSATDVAGAGTSLSDLLTRVSNLETNSATHGTYPVVAGNVTI